jgi:hypothetical protein
MTEITPLPEDKTTIAAKYMAAATCTNSPSTWAARTWPQPPRTAK